MFPQPVPSLRPAVSQWLQRWEEHFKIFHGFISRNRGKEVIQEIIWENFPEIEGMSL